MGYAESFKVVIHRRTGTNCIYTFVGIICTAVVFASMVVVNELRGGKI
jgi:hypothetical protein